MTASTITRYNGGKNGAGVYQAIINTIPAHRVYVEAFAGSAAIYRRKKAAALSILIEKNPAVAQQLRATMPAASVINDDAVPLLLAMHDRDLSGWFIYLDPPYLHSTRRDLTLYGDFELSEADHAHLVASVLPALSAAGARWALSGYRSQLYDDAAGLFGWHRKDFQAMTRRGLATESLWTNYNPDDEIPAEYTFAGESFRERERLKRKAARWVAKLMAMPAGERRFMLTMLASAGEAGSCNATLNDGIPSP